MHALSCTPCLQVKAEIAERVREMEKIDYLLRQAHARADEDA